MTPNHTLPLSMKPIIILLLLCGLLLTPGCTTPRQSKANPPKLIILKAVYGIGNQTIEVTAAVSSLVDGDAIHVPPGWGMGEVDPAIGKVKTVTIAYQYQGRIQLASFPQTQEIIVPLIR
jgi:hypothetical protein